MRYTDTHEWVALDEKSGVATVGITEYAERELGEVVYIELPLLGKQVGQGDEVVIVESTKAAIDLYTPLTGTIVEVNEALRNAPEKINKDPLKEGWLYRVKITLPSEYKELLGEDDYQKLIQTN